jgi:hypothetical protein
MSYPIESCAVCVAGDKHLNPHHFLRDVEATEVVLSTTVHPGCKRDAESWSKEFLSDKHHFRNGAYRWKSNEHVVPAEIVTFWAIVGYITTDDAAASNAIGKAETAAFLAAYRKNPPKYTPEQLAEMRAAFGPGAKVVNVITGQEIEL